MIDAVEHFLYKGCSPLRRFGGAGREPSHFARYDRETMTVLSGARRFHRGVESEKLRLPRDLLHQYKEGADLVHCRRHCVDPFSAFERVGSERLE